MNFLEYVSEFMNHLPEVFTALTTQPIGWLTLLLCVMMSLAVLSLVERLIKLFRTIVKASKNYLQRRSESRIAGSIYRY